MVTVIKLLKLISGSNKNEDLKLPTLVNFCNTIYITLPSAISGTKSFPSRNYSDVFVKKIEKRYILIQMDLSRPLDK